MGLLRRLVTERDESTDRPYECLDCEARFDHRRQVCPSCGGFRIERPDW